MSFELHPLQVEEFVLEGKRGDGKAALSGLFEQVPYIQEFWLFIYSCMYLFLITEVFLNNILPPNCSVFLKYVQCELQSEFSSMILLKSSVWSTSVPPSHPCQLLFQCTTTLVFQALFCSLWTVSAVSLGLSHASQGSHAVSSQGHSRISYNIRVTRSPTILTTLVGPKLP